MRSFFSLSLLTAVAAKENPIRRIVTLLQDMQKEISAEIEKEQTMYKKYECWVKKTTATLQADIAKAKQTAKSEGEKYASFDSEAKAAQATVEQNQKLRLEAKKQMEAADAQRAEESAKAAKSSGDSTTDLAALQKAIAAIEKGMGKGAKGEFLQTNSGVRNLVEAVANSAAAETHLDAASLEVIQSFLQNPTASYGSASGEIVGILKQMEEDMAGDAADAAQAEKESVAAYEAAKKALAEQVKIASETIEAKKEEKGAAAVAAVEAKAASETAKKEGDDAEASFAEVSAQAESQKEVYFFNQKNGAAEIKAIGEAIGILNNDDALETFKSTDTKAFTQLSLLQVSKRSNKAPTVAAKEQLVKLQKSASSSTISLLAFTASQALGAKKVDFSKILKMIDDMVALLIQEQENDRKSLDQCQVDQNRLAMERKDLDHALAGQSAKIEELSSVIETQTQVVADAEADIAAAEKAVHEAGEQRTEQSGAFTEDVALNNDAIELLAKAKDKLNAFYNPDLVRTEQRTETAQEAAARVEASFLSQPATLEKRSASTQKSGGVLALLDQLSNELSSEVQKLTSDETKAQTDYEKLVADMNEQIKTTQEAKAGASATKAQAESDKADTQEKLDASTEESDANKKNTHDVEAACKFIQDNFEDRKTKRTAEREGLKTAKSILSGAKLE